MEELEDLIIGIFGQFAAKKTEKKKRLPSEMDLMIDLQSNETIIREYLQGFSTEEICIKNNKQPKTIDKIIDTYNYLYS